MPTTDPAVLVGALFAREPSVLADPYPAYTTLREAGPAIYVPAPPGAPPAHGAWHVFGYAEASTVLRDHRFSSSRHLGGPQQDRLASAAADPAVGFMMRMMGSMMLTKDGKDHSRLRGLVQAAFTPRVIERLRSDVQSLVDNLLDEATARDASGFDLVPDLAMPLPAIVIARLLGVPEEDWATFKRMSDGIIGGELGPQKFANFHALGQYLQRAVDQRRAAPTDDLIGGLVAAQLDDGDALSDDELIAQVVALMVGGHETTTYALGSAIVNLLRTPGAWAGLGESTTPAAVEECLRFDPPFQSLARRAATDVELAGQVIRENDTVWCWIAAANRDPARFPDPERFDPARADNRHLSFGLGPHFCLGAALARLELQTAIAALRQRFPDLRLREDEVAWNTVSMVRGPRNLPLVVA